MDHRTIGERLERTEALDALADPIRRLAVRLLPKGAVKDVLHGVWLGHPFHPLLTDLPIGFWTSSLAVDLLAGERGRSAADTLLALGTLSALPTAVAGLADWSELNRPERRTGVVHAVANVTAVAMYGVSLLARRRGRRGMGVGLSVAGAAAASAGGFLGGHLSYRRGAGVNQNALTPAPSDWVEVDGGLPTGSEPVVASLDSVPLVVVPTGGGEVAVLSDRCGHLGGPLHEGTIAGGCVRCPWHGSTFRLADGSVVHGPATAPQPAYEAEREGGTLRVRRRLPN